MLEFWILWGLCWNRAGEPGVWALGVFRAGFKSAQSETISHSVITCRMKSRVCLALCKLTSDFLLTLSLTTPFMNPSWLSPHVCWVHFIFWVSTFLIPVHLSRFGLFWGLIRGALPDFSLLALGVSITYVGLQFWRLFIIFANLLRPLLQVSREEPF